MRPFFSYYGAKYTVAKYAGEPRRDLVVEGFVHGGKVRAPKKQSRFAVVRELTAIRVRQEVTRDDLEAHVGYHKMMIGRFERGETTPSLKTLTDWANALGFEITVKAK